MSTTPQKHFGTMFFKTLLYSFFIILNLMHWTQGARVLEIRFTNLTYEVPTKSAFTCFEASLRELPSGRKAMRLEFILKETLPAFDVIVDLKVPRLQHKSWARLTQLKLNGCDFLNPNFKPDRVTKSIIQAVRYGNSIIPQCPVEPHKLILIDRFYLHTEDFPPVLPEMLVYANFSLIVKKKIYFSMYGNFEITRNAPPTVATKL